MHRIIKEAEEEREGTEYKQLVSLGGVQVLRVAFPAVAHREWSESASGRVTCCWLISRVGVAVRHLLLGRRVPPVSTDTTRQHRIFPSTL
ncbi:hypothetical protein E2C01_016399 [Portunus trituberculatus]|uniref:Uncharacterized protein n=1 Tax=Portunus trituberculatus TaxID=210409 RepID=A0A5B7DQ61_PORTR|nr:hypothetical protein [Portunus trituberculatus]